MRVLLITRHMPARSIVPVDRGGGGNTFIEALLELPLLSDDLDIDVVALHPEGEPIDPPPRVTITYVRSERLHRWLWDHREAKNPFAAVFVLVWTAYMLIGAALRRSRERRYDLIYAVGGPIAGAAGIVVKHLRRLPLAMHFQYTYNFRRASLPIRLGGRAFYGQTDALIGNCAMLGEDAVAIGVPAERCHWVFNWIDQDAFRPLEPRERYRAEHRVEPSQTAFYFGGRFDYTKHVDRLIDALRDLDEPRAVFFFAGDGVLAPELRALAAANPNVRVLGTVPRADLPALHAAADLQFWNSVDIDYPGLVAIEAMSSGLPLYTSNQTMNPLYPGARVEPSFLGVPRLAKLFDPTRDGIRQAIREAIERRDELVALRPEVAAFARAHFGPANALELIAILRSCAFATAAAARDASGQSARRDGRISS
ncbi:MAG TPA: glycosyltransferase [Candidatus Elarobacter sp.]|nr:glycosyltransferase [Candidatus Elarobacter sp.]